MRLLGRIGALMGGAAGLLAVTSANAQIPVEDLARTPAVTNVTMSSDGSYLVGLMTPPGDKGEELALAVWDLENSQGPVITPGNDRMRFIAAQALKADKLFAVGRQAWTGPAGRCGIEGRSIGNTRTFLTKLYMTSTDMDDFEEPFQKAQNMLGTSEATQLCFELTGTAGLHQDLPLDPNDVIAQRLNTASLNAEYIRVDLESGREELIYRENSREAAGLFDSRTGELLTQSRIEPTGGGDYDFEILLKNPSTGAFEVHDKLTTTASGRHSVSIAGRDEETGKYYVITDLMSDDLAEVYFYDPQTREFDDEPMFATRDFSATGVILGSTEADFNQLLGFTYGGAVQKTYYVDPEWDSIQKGLEQAFPGQNISFGNYTGDKSKIMFTVSSSTNPPTYYLLRDKSRTDVIGAARPWIKSDQLRATELVNYQARDGMKIPGFLTLPAGWEKSDGPLPSIVLPHGGPWARDSAGWDSSGWPQFLASRGYAVLQPQYRGSTGFGRKLWMAGDAEWGQKMQDDKDDGAQWLVEQGIADPNRMAIFGYSYGGFAAFAATVRENGPFRCAIAGAGVADLAKLDNSWSENRLQRALQGRTVKGMDPMNNTSKANIPILIYHGDRDTRVPLFHSQDFYNAVKDKVNAKLVVIDDMPHSLPWWPEQHRESLSEIESFLASDCGMNPAG
ncbi:alpha/beta hydrolase family protein [Euryhalocaulis caribicus]|uniref:alpha/beta hydrolase family protein n=1 Tax=Euryhalocaulis caribicus TaxID=1161401 RepID=UPI0003B44B31|nr:prolyl oligopeptidase family serine peptidase [Euryhalocaulis caribicus]